MNLIELNRALGQLRLGGIAAVLETRVRQAQTEAMPPIDFLSCLVSDELTRRGERLLERRKKQAEFCHEDGLFLGPPGTGKSHLAQAIGHAAIQQGYRVLYRETHKLLDDLAEATIDGTRKECMELFVSVSLLIIDDLGMRKLAMTAAEDLLEIVMRRYERASTLLTSTDRSTTGASCSATAPPLPRCSIASSITAMYSNAAHEVCARKQTCLLRRRRSKTTLSQATFGWPVLK
jgi:hypothetical protein